MENEEKVFHSEISRVDCETDNHLYDLLKIEPAVPVPHHTINTYNDDWDFKPKDKIYFPKHSKSKLRVKTVSEVRALFEKDVCDYLSSDLEQQQNYLLRKIRDGASTDEKTRKNAIALLYGDTPISRRSWLMLSTINPEKHKHFKQYVLWHGKCVQVNGSRGGKTKFICNHDLKKKQNNTKISPRLKTSSANIKKGLLRNSLKVKFKPGPLRKKKYLDDSHQKYQMGDIELVKLPTPVLEITPTHGTVLEPTIANFVNKLRGEKGDISQKYAEFSVSVLGSLKTNTLLQIDKNCTVTFDLNYKCEQNRILMRRNVAETPSLKNIDINKQFESKLIQDACVDESDKTQPTGDITDTFPYNEPIFEIRQIMNDMLSSVEISLNQDTMYCKEDELRDIIAEDSEDSTTLKDKTPKRKHCELDKLDVTIIKIPESSKKDFEKPCGKAFCTKGCVCDSLDCTLRLKQHCGVIDCMFGCKCEVSKYKNIDLLGADSGDIIPGLLNLDNEINSHLAREEQKFHQTVVVSGDKSILLKSRKRHWKCSSKYAEFYSKLNLKGEEKLKKLTVDIERLPCKNIEPLCMVHNLYKCFCQGRFIESYVKDHVEHKLNNTGNTKVDQEITKESDSGARTILRPRLQKFYVNNKRSNQHNKNDVGKDTVKHCSSENTDDWNNSIYLTDENEEYACSSARTIGYHGRKYSELYYFNTNRKILEMERNDTLLKKKMLRLVNGNGTNQIPTSETLNNSSELLDCETLSNNDDIEDNTISRAEDNDNDISNKSVNKSTESSYPFAKSPCQSNLKKWLEISYKCYKERLEKGTLKNCLEAPKKGKAALQTWDFVLSRYRERKNIFFVSKLQPFRTFLAVDDKHQFFAQQCTNIDDIRFADLPKYPLIIRNLVTNSTDTENSFCILRGWDHCWELIGSAVKVFEQNDSNHAEENESLDTEMMNNSSSDSDSNSWYDHYTADKYSVGQEYMSSQNTEKSNEITNEDQNPKNDNQAYSEKSKWFVLQIENDFTEIQFYRKGFYVTYEGIQRSITLARISGKTVRLSSRARTDKSPNNAHPYGIYAIPCISECCVFIGPYEINEPLGIEVVKSISNFRKNLADGNEKKTRGIWINTNKVENSKVIDNPLAYLPSESTLTETWMDLDGIPTLEASPDINANPKANLDITKEAAKQEDKALNSQKDTINKNTQILEKGKKTETASKQIKPIKIRRTNGFYHLTSKNILHKVTKSDSITNKNNILKNLIMKPEPLRFPSIAPIPYIALPGPSTSAVACVRPVAEIAPQIKITHVYSERKSTETLTSENSKGSSMLVLKPEEINKKILAKPADPDEMATDIEKFLETSTICIAPQDEVLVISDGEDEPDICKDVWIQCSNVKSFGYIRAKINDDNHSISFEFPGFKYSEFYQETEAFDKINQVLARKIYIPKNITLQWQVVRNKQNLTSAVLTPECLEDKKYLLMKIRQQRDQKTRLLKVSAITTKNENPETVCKTPQSKDEQIKLIQGLEEASRKLEHQSAVLWNEAVTRRDEIYGSLTVPDNLKEKMSEALQEILSLNKH